MMVEFLLMQVMSKRFYTVSQGQTLLDISLEIYGDLEGVFTLIEQNPELSRVEEPLSPGQQLLIDSTQEVNTDIAFYFQTNQLKINSRGDEIEEEVIVEDGLTSFDEILLISSDNIVLKAIDQ